MKGNSKTQQQEESFYTRALVDVKTIVENETEKSFWVTFATENPVYRRGWEENFNEILSCIPAHIRASRLEESAVPLLDNHNRWEGVGGQLGIVIDHEFVLNLCRAKILFSTRGEFTGIWSDIKAGVIRSISCGYNVYKYIREVVSENTIPNYRAVDWEPLEISLAPVPADYKSRVRSSAAYVPHEIIIEDFLHVQNTRSNMTPGEQPVIENVTAPVVVAEPEIRSVGPAVVTSTITLDENRIRSEGAAMERTRQSDIRKAVSAAKLGVSFADELVNSGVSVEAARAAIIDKLSEQDPTPAVRTGLTSVTVIGDERDNVRMAMSDALLHRAQPGSIKLEDKSSNYKHMDMLTMARHCLIASGDTGALSYSPSEVVKRAIATTDYPNLLNSTVERTIRKTYEAYPATWKHIAKQTTAKDFREKTGIAVDGKVDFEEIAEGGEYKNSFIIMDDSAKIKLKTYGRKISITRQSIINDDLEVFQKLPKLISQGAANFQANKVWSLILNNAKTPDGIALFNSATHKNLAASGSVISEASLSAARVAMWRHKTPAGEPMPIAPKYLVVPMEQMTVAEKIMASILANATGDVNVFAGKLQIMTDPRITHATEWYLAGDPMENEGLVYAYLQGEEGLFIDKEISFADDCVTTKARLDFDAANWDYRNWYKNPGA